MAENIEALETKFQNGFNINAKFNICEYIDETPIILALCENKTKVIHWLLSKTVELNKKGNPAILMACSNCNIETIKLLLLNGANLNAKHEIGKTAMNDAQFGNNYDAISFLIDNGYDKKKKEFL